MRIRISANAEKRDALDALIIPFWKTDEGPTSGFPNSWHPRPACELSDRLLELARGPMQARDFTGKEGEIVWVWAHELERRIGLLGLGAQSGVSAERLRRSYFKAMRAALSRKAKTYNIILPVIETLPFEISCKALLEGIHFASYAFDKLKHDVLVDEPTVRPEEVVLITSEMHAAENAANYVQKVMQAVFFARDLVNSNADDVTPQYLGTCATRMSQEFGRIETKVYSKKWLEEQGMGLVLAVAKGSSCDPAFIHMHYEGDPTSKDHTVLIGKGITFDTGGLNLKPTGSMETMREDMGGAAVCMATLQAIASLGLNCNVSVVIAATENAIGSRAFKPGDVYKSYAGKTVEITNTDAEGRLILADAISYAVAHLNPTRIIDVATLTGAMDIAVGSEVIGYFSNSDSLAAELEQAGHRTYERIWRFPLYEEYREQLKSDVADIKNRSRRQGGAVLAAIFLKEFVKDIPWAHFDIAGNNFFKEPARYWQRNATGMGVRLLVDYFEKAYI
jgi:leucyl aminopeptidase